MKSNQNIKYIFWWRVQILIDDTYNEFDQFSKRPSLPEQDDVQVFQIRPEEKIESFAI